MLTYRTREHYLYSVGIGFQSPAPSKSFMYLNSKTPVFASLISNCALSSVVQSPGLFHLQNVNISSGKRSEYDELVLTPSTRRQICIWKWCIKDGTRSLVSEQWSLNYGIRVVVILWRIMMWWYKLIVFEWRYWTDGIWRMVPEWRGMSDGSGVMVSRDVAGIVVFEWWY